MFSHLHRRIFHGCAAAVVAVALVACGGGGSSGSPVNLPNPPAGGVGMGALSVLFTDAPSDEFANINVTIAGAELIGGNSGRVTLFSGERTLDLLALERFTEVFSVTDEVPAGRYSKIRFDVLAMELVRRDADGNITDIVEPRLPGNGKLDLNPRGGFDVVAGENLVVEIDWDVDKSLHLHQLGNGEWKFRPVLFVDIVADGALPSKLTRVHGTVTEADPDAHQYVVCREPAADAAVDARCIVVAVSEQTGIFDPAGDVADESLLTLETPVTVIGMLNPDTEAADDMQRLLLDAAVVEVGPRGTFAAFSGTATAPADDMGQFPFALAPRQGFVPGTEVDVLLQPATRIFSRGGEPLDAAAIDTDIDGEVEGVLQLSNDMPDLLKAALVILDTEPDEIADELAGNILSVDPALSSLVVATDEGDRCVSAPDSDIFLIVVSDDAVDSSMVSLDELSSGMRAEIFGVMGIDGCFVAETILAFPAE